MGNVVSTTVGGWLAIGLLGAGYWYYLQQDQVRRAARSAVKSKEGRHQQPTSNEKKVKEPKPKRQKLEDSKRGSSYAAVAKQSAPAVNTPTAAASYSSDEDNGADNREFARLLSKAKNGTNYTGKSKEETRQKTVKQSRAAETNTGPKAAAPAPAPVSAPSSTAGIDADDDQSSVASPVANARDVSGVSDMLEAPSSGPSILRLTDTEEKKKPQKKTKLPEPTETKKQRQNRQKAEAAKLLREESEKDRKVKQEAQRRTAREAEGRAAKDGSGFMAAQAANNAWKGDTNNKVNGAKTNGGTSQSNGFVPVQPLDTYEPSSRAVDTDASKSSSKNGGSWMSSIPSEEEQMDMIRQETADEEWSTVKTKPRKAKKAAADSGSNDEATSADNLSVKPIAPKQAKAETVPQQPKTATRPTKALGQQSSFALLKNEGATEEVEEEWDV